MGNAKLPVKPITRWDMKPQFLEFFCYWIPHYLIVIYMAFRPYSHIVFASRFHSSTWGKSLNLSVLPLTHLQNGQNRFNLIKIHICLVHYR